MKSLLSVLFLLFISISFAQQKHTVAAKETVYGISKHYGISQEQLVSANPSIKEIGLKIGDVLTIPNQGAPAPKLSTQIKEDANYKYIKVAPKETLYAISKKYNVSINQLKEENPSLEEGLKIGDVLRIPKEKVYENISKVEEVIIDERSIDEISEVKEPEVPVVYDTIKDKNIIHKVGKKENALSLMLEYNLTYKDLLKFNPEIGAKGINYGDELTFPIWIKPSKMAKFQDQRINLVLMLPFHLKQNDKKYLRDISVNFLTGAEMALDSLGKQGYNLHLKVVDTENNPRTIKKFLDNYNMDEVDAVIGPFYGNLVEELAEEFQDDYLPIFSPQNNDVTLEKFNNVYLSKPRDERLADEIVEELLKRYSGEQIILLTDNQNQKLANYTKQLIEEQSEIANVVITKSINELVQPSEVISETLEDGSKFEQEYFTPIIAVLVSSNNNLGKSFVNKLKEMNPENLYAYGIGYVNSYDHSNQTNMRSLYDIGFAYSSTYKSNMQKNNVKKLANKFKALYCTSPGKYQQNGFDLTYDVVSRMNDHGFLGDNIYKKQSGFSGGFLYKDSEEGSAKINSSVKVFKLFKKDKHPVLNEDVKL